MARLYGEVHTDRSNGKTFVANERFLITLFYGSKDNSKEFARIRVSYPKGSNKPKIEVFEK